MTSLISCTSGGEPVPRQLGRVDVAGWDASADLQGFLSKHLGKSCFSLSKAEIKSVWKEVKHLNPALFLNYSVMAMGFKGKITVIFNIVIIVLAC